MSSARDLLVRDAIAVETALWSAVRALGDHATTLETAQRIGQLQVAELYAQRAKETRTQADVARKFVLDLTG